MNAVLRILPHYLISILFLCLSGLHVNAQVFAPGTTTTDVSCPGGSDGTITYNLLGNGPLSYTWSDGDAGVTLGNCTYSVQLDNTGAPQTNFQIPVNVTLAAGMNPDFSNVEILDSAGNAYTFWIQDYPVAGNATFWVLVPNIPSGNFGFFLSFCGSSTISASDPWTTFDFFDDFDDGNIADWTPGCERATTSGEYCTQNVSATINWSPGFSLHLFEHGSCFTSPYNGAASTVSQVIPLTNYDYVIDYDDRATVELYGFCSGNTGGRNRTYADGVNLGNGSGGGQGGSCATRSFPWAYQTSGNFNVVTGSADIKLMTTGGDCANTNGWFDNVRIRRWSPDPINVTIDSSAFIVKTGLAAGTYVVTVTDVSGNVFVDSLVINEPAAIVLNEDGNDISCNGGTDGQAYIVPNGGTPAYTVAWSNSASTDTISNLLAGTYTVTLTDNNGCVDSASVTITDPAAITTSTVTTDIACFGDNNGTAEVTPSGGTPGYSYTWSNSAITSQINGLAAGDYFVTVNDISGCTAADTVTITEPTELTVDVNIGVDVLCFGVDNGELTSTVAGGSGTYTYAWSNAATTSDISGLAPGTYILTVTDTSNCIAIDSAILSNPTAIEITLDSTNVACFGNTDGTINATVVGGASGYTYDWSNGEASQNLTDLSQGAYTVSVTDANGCVESATTTIEGAPELITDFSAVTASCEGLATGSINPAISGGTDPLSYSWSNGDTSLTQTTLAPGDYTLTITDGNGCTTTETITVDPDPVDLVVSIDPDTLVQFGEDATLTATTSNPNDIVTWAPGTFLSDSTGLIVTAAPDEGTYTYTATATNLSGCTATDSITFTVENEAVFYVPNAFSPNGDGLNDVFDIEVQGAVNVIAFQVFDRSGEIVYNGDGATGGWDGTMKGKELPPGIFVYRIAFNTGTVGRSRQLQRLQGSVTLIR